MPTRPAGSTADAPTTGARVRLLDAGVTVIRTKGLSATTIDDLCTTAGVTKGAFFHHFESKEAFAVVVAEHWSATTAVLFEHAPYHDHSDPVDRVLGYIDFRASLIDGSTAPEYSCLVGTMSQEVYDTSPIIRDACGASILGHAATLESDIAAALGSGTDTDIDVSGLARYTQIVLQGAFVVSKAANDPDVALDASSPTSAATSSSCSIARRPQRTSPPSRSCTRARHQCTTGVSPLYREPMQPAAVLWDMDGTLVDTEPYWIACEHELVAEFDGTWTSADAHSIVGYDLLDAAVELRDRGGVRLDPPAIVERLLDGVIARAAHELPWRPGAARLLADCADAGIPCALVTMSWRRLADAVIAASPAGSFIASITGDEVSNGKPDPEPYLAAAAALGVDAARCVAIEDSPTGVASALAAGCATLGVPHVVPLAPAPGLTIVASLADLALADLGLLLDR